MMMMMMLGHGGRSVRASWWTRTSIKVTDVLPHKVRRQYETSAAAAEATTFNRDDGENLFDWNNLGFGLVPTDYMYIMKCNIQENQKTFSPGKLTNFGNVELNPSSGILNYGQGLIEGLKAYRTNDKRIMLFRPELNALRMQIGAERMCMPSPSTQQFVGAIKETVLANKRWMDKLGLKLDPEEIGNVQIGGQQYCHTDKINDVAYQVPPPGKGSLYIRPLLMGSGAVLGLGPAPEYTFVVYASPVGPYCKGPYHLLIEEEMSRAFIGGTGCVKAITNYAPIYKTSAQAKAKGFSDVLFMDSKTGKYVEEASAANIFVVKGSTISTPPASLTILPGITRRSIIEMATHFRLQVEERPIRWEELFDADEVFCTGTAMVVKPVSSITLKEQRREFNTEGETISQRLHKALIGMQTGEVVDTMGWTTKFPLP